VVIFGENHFFSSDGDLDTVRQIANPTGGHKMISLMQDNLARLQNLPLITVGYVEGMALGGGAELLTACDFLLAASNSVIGFVQVRVGITAVWGGGARLVSLIGYNKALNLIATGRTVSGEEAAKLGFVDHVLPPINTVKDPATGRPVFKPFKDQQRDVFANAEQYLQPFLNLPRET